MKAGGGSAERARAAAARFQKMRMMSQKTAGLDPYAMDPQGVFAVTIVTSYGLRDKKIEQYGCWCETVILGTDLYGSLMTLCSRHECFCYLYTIVLVERDSLH